MAGRILTLEALAEHVARLKADGLKIVMCHGVFDLLHVGHIRHLEQSGKKGDVLVVTLTPDQFVEKGTHRPAFQETLRAEAVAALAVVDYVAINRWPTAAETIHLLRPDIYCKGGEYREKQIDGEKNLIPEVRAAEAVGARLEYTDDLVFSSSHLLNNYFSPFSPETDEWLRRFRKERVSEEIIRYLDGMRPLRVLVVGEAILDEYVFCDVIGKSTKDPILACHYVATETFAGGSLAVANHLSGFCSHVGLVACLGETERREEFIRDSLLPEVQPQFVTKNGAPTIHKRRFLDQYSQNKLLELYVMDDSPLNGSDEGNLVEILDTVLEDYDVVISADYGHGMMTPSSADILCDRARFLAVDTQANAGNRGLNPVSKYRRADYVCLATHEVRIETRIREGNPRDRLKAFSQHVDCPKFTETRGKWGSLHYDRESGFLEVPAFATRVSDRVGGGDAVLALTSLMVAQGAPWDIVGFVGNLAGAQMVTELGNRCPVNKLALAKHIISLLK